MADNKTAFHSNLSVSSSPHIVTKMDTQRTMIHVLIALIPACVMAVFYFGTAALIRIILGPVFCWILEFAYDKLLKKPNTTKDCSCLVTGVILALNLPSSLAIWQEFIGCIVAIIVVKCLYGGIGKNIANPAIVGRIVLLLSYSSEMASWPLTRLQLNGTGVTFISSSDLVDAVTGATAIGALDDPGTWLPSLQQLFLGNIGGAMGETCALAILIGGAFLIWKKVISPIIPCTYIATVFVFALIYYGITGAPSQYTALGMAFYHILCGGVMFGAFFCATDYVTSPILKPGKFIYAIGLGLMTMLIRLFGSYPEGVSFAILLMNILTPLINRVVERQYYGISKREKEAKRIAKQEAKAEKIAAKSPEKEAPADEQEGGKA